MVLRDETVSCFKLVVEKESILKCLLKCTSVHVQSSFFRSEPWSRFETPVVNIVPQERMGRMVKSRLSSFLF